MRKQILFLIPTILLFASCSTIHLTKKLYSDGYYVSANKKANNHSEAIKNNSLLKPDKNKSAIDNNKENKNLETASIDRVTPLPASKSYFPFTPKKLNNQELINKTHISEILKNKITEKVAAIVSKMDAKSAAIITKKQNIKGIKQTQDDGGKILGLIAFCSGVLSLASSIGAIAAIASMAATGLGSGIFALLAMLGIILGIVGLSIGIKGIKSCAANTDKAGLPFAIIGTATGALGLILGAYFLFYGLFVWSMLSVMG